MTETMVTMINLDLFSGKELLEKVKLEKIVVERVARVLEKRVLNDGGWNIKDLSEKILTGIQEINDGVRMPKKQPFKNFEIAINAMNYCLLIKVDGIWQQTEFAIKTRPPEPEKNRKQIQGTL